MLALRLRSRKLPGGSCSVPPHSLEPAWRNRGQHGEAVHSGRVGRSSKELAEGCDTAHRGRPGTQGADLYAATCPSGAAADSITACPEKTKRVWDGYGFEVRQSGLPGAVPLSARRPNLQH